MIDPLAKQLVEVLSDRHLTIATAESATAGLCAATIADVPGASVVLRGGLVTYATDLKAHLAGVDAQVLSECGPVSELVATQMATGAARACSADLGIGITGVAGPEPQDGHPVGEIYIATAFQGHVRVRNISEEYEDLQMKGVFNDADDGIARARVRSLAVNCALLDAAQHVLSVE